ncbi:hypothetical protein G8A07_15065 [Roseateles sp. DAIF2]|uniref:succinylglutamate desuccinylase/aspartoacylase domain-containing protein n=1 Tax=Roseateles sp. DAIF2 TaxID=2714952 RepID=UPI0018A316AC|nr:succinylglutamate desuccinylase/aspartoacylase family protein [Roseateles sp. DAIF2]QPF74101.1 hypothetical protein G8A07_15065 [Roseateles sp. DAIF2]
MSFAPATLLELELPRTLEQLLERAAREKPRRLEAWLFEDQGARRAAEQRLARLGINAELRSAYKPLLHHFLEELGLAARRVEIATPPAQLQRLRAEAYPLAGLLSRAERLDFVTDAALAPGRVRITRDEGAPLELFLPIDAQGAPTAWLRWWPAGGGRLEEGALHSDYRALFDAVLAAVAARDWPAEEPYFERLLIEIETGGIERPLDWGQELISTREALHEDLYFSLLEFFQRRAGRSPGDRRLRPGQIVPLLRPSSGASRLRLRLAGADDPPAPLPPTPLPRSLAELEAPLHPEQVQTLLAALPGERHEFRSHQGRPVTLLHRRGAKPGVVISAGQHGNESSGVIGALRAAEALQRGEPEAHYALVALENPDGAALHHRLSRDHPRHMAHAARFTALGDDLEARDNLDDATRLGEKAARLRAIALTGAGLHFSLHGYPAHEWTRPFSGYLPPRAEDWALPKGFFLILRQHPGRDGLPFLRALTAQLAEDAELREFNERQQRLWRAHGGEWTYPLLNGIPCLVNEDSRSTVPFTLISEIPDETIYGPAMRFAQRIQTELVLRGCALYWDGLLGTGLSSAR